MGSVKLIYKVCHKIQKYKSWYFSSLSLSLSLCECGLHSWVLLYWAQHWL